MKKIHDKLASINLVEDIIFTYEGSAHLKDLNSGKYLLFGRICKRFCRDGTVPFNDCF